MPAGRLFAVVLILSSCAAPIRERCLFVTEDVAPPRMPREFTEIDQLLVQRARSMSSAARQLKRSLTNSSKRVYLEEILPRLCDLLAEARAQAARGELTEAGTRYQGLLVASQVMQLEVAMLQMADLADERGQVSTQIAAQLTLFDQEMAPVMKAALSRDRAQLAAAMPVGVRRYGEWSTHLDRWAAQLKVGQERVRIAKALWDTLMVAVAAHELAGAAAGAIPRSGPPAFGGAIGAGGTVAAQVDAAAIARAVEAIRKLIVIGALDPAVVAGVSAMAGVSSGGLEAPRPMAMAQGSSGPPKQPKFRAFKSFEAFKKEMGKIGPDHNWHHIVEQTPSNVRRFGAEALHNTDNVIKMDAQLHQRISRLYSSIRSNITYTNLTVRQWLSTQPYEAQREFGLRAIDNVTNGSW